ncbi:MAG TPA: ATP-binding cassette domain-containing protein, partial [Acidisoma sp.]|nr:ATP-binding cassette domain-containing protein [Acidisoma sp.]
MDGNGTLRFNNVVKAFGGTRALKGVSFAVPRGEVVALLGENGAGKSTLIKILGGIVRADEGAVSIDGVPYRHHVQSMGGAGHRSAAHRVAFIHQDLGLIEWMTVAENMSLAEGFAGRPRLLGAIDWRRTEERAAEALARIGCDIDPGVRV